MSIDHGDTNKSLGGKRTYTVEEIAKILGIGRTAAYAHILDEDRKVNAQKFESAFYANPDLRSVKAPDEPQPALDVQSIIVQLQQSPKLLSALTSLISNQGCK